jgi:hypothetical protein
MDFGAHHSALRLGALRDGVRGRCVGIDCRSRDDAMELGYDGIELRRMSD